MPLYTTTWAALKLKDKLPEAMAEFHKGSGIGSGQADAHYTLGVTLWQQGDFAAAQRSSAEQFMGKPDYAEAYSR